MNGILNLDKPTGWTSHDVVGFVRRRLGVRRVGHAGTLDPFATGVLLVCVGQATRVAEYLAASTKTYLAIAELGISTDTYDRDGTITARAPVPPLGVGDLVEALTGFEGELEQVPPAFSAIKQGGVPAYRRARRGEEVIIPARRVRIHAIRLLDWQPPHATFEVACDPGTYIRSIAHDLGQALGCGAILTELTRTRSGAFRVEDAITPDLLAEAAAHGQAAVHLHPLQDALRDLTPVPVAPSDVQRLAQGQAVEGDPSAIDRATGYAVGPEGDVHAILRYDAAVRLWRPVKVFISSPTGEG
jgi:tRNA pseudouridine55 synthase